MINNVTDILAFYKKKALHVLFIDLADLSLILNSKENQMYYLK